MLYIEHGLGTWRPRNLDLISGKEKGFFSSPKQLNCLQSPPSLVFNVSWGLSPRGAKRPYEPKLSLELWNDQCSISSKVSSLFNTETSLDLFYGISNSHLKTYAPESSDLRSVAVVAMRFYSGAPGTYLFWQNVNLHPFIYLEESKDRIRCFRQLQRVSCPAFWSPSRRPSCHVVLWNCQNSKP
jgi:hypothetical protein